MLAINDDDMESVPDPIDCLLSCSGSPYVDVLPGPPQISSRKGAWALTGWENVKPNAVYDLTATSNSQEPRRRKRHFTDQLLLRDVVSMPNLCTKRPGNSETQKWSAYMSGELDEQFSYVYTGGLSERSCKTNPNEQIKKSSPHGHNPQRASVSTCNLALDPASLFNSRLHIEPVPRTQYGQISKMFAMQLKPELLAQQLLVEKRLRNVDPNTHPDLQKDVARSGREKSDTECTDAATSLVHSKSTNLQQTRKLKRQRRPQPKMWQPPVPANEESHQQLPMDLSFNATRSCAHASNRPRISTKHSNYNSDVPVNSKTRLHNQFGFGSFHAGISPGKKLTQVQQVPRSGEKIGNKSTEKQRKATYHIIFDRDRHTQGSRSSPTSQPHAWKQEHSQSIPVFVPSLEQEQAMAMIPKRFSKLTALQLKPSPSTSNSVITDRLFYGE